MSYCPKCPDCGLYHDGYGPCARPTPTVATDEDPLGDGSDFGVTGEWWGATDEVIARVTDALRKTPALGPMDKRGIPTGELIDFEMLARAAISSTRMDELIERARAWPAGADDTLSASYVDALLNELTEALTTLQSEIATLRRENVMLRKKRKLKIVPARPVTFEVDAALSTIGGGP